MKFDDKHYVPVLKLKTAEKEALPQLSQTVRARITPLFEVVERVHEKKPTIEDHLDTAFKKLDTSVEHVSQYFLDCRRIAPDGPDAAEAVFQRADNLGKKFVPVTGISRTEDVEAALAHRNDGLALRLTVDDFECGRVQNDLLPFITTHGVPREVIDLIVDLDSVEHMVLPGVQALAAACLAEVPSPGSWRTLTISAAGFPPGMRGLDTQAFDLVARLDWLAWRDGVRGIPDLARLPTFSDAVIQHPAPVEGFDFTTMTASASVRYTTGDEWLRIKGVSTRVQPPSEQFENLATQLVLGNLRSRFRGTSHCNGCEGIWRCANGDDNLGSQSVWYRLGTIHHITHVIEQLAALHAT